jgi:hypothetical protein
MKLQSVHITPRHTLTFSTPLLCASILRGIGIKRFDKFRVFSCFILSNGSLAWSA